MSLVKYIVKRIIVMLPVLFGALTIGFFLSRMMPGDPVFWYLYATGNPHPQPAQYASMVRQLGLDQPVIIQYFRYLGELFTGNWGISISLAQGEPVWDFIMQRLPRTIDITILSMIIASIIGIKSGVISAKKRNKTGDTFIRFMALIGVSIPVYFLGMILQYYVSYELSNLTPIMGSMLLSGGIIAIVICIIFMIFGKLIDKKFLRLTGIFLLIIGIFLIYASLIALDIILHLPSEGFKNMAYTDPAYVTGFRAIDAFISGEWYMITDYFNHLILPVLCLSFITIASITRQTRSSMLEVLEQDYIRTARAKGCKEKDVINSHALKNSLIPTVTVIGLNFASLLGGAVLTESTFNLDGIGGLLIDCVRNVDYWVLSALIFTITLMFVIVVLITDLIYAFLDPRIRY